MFAQKKETSKKKFFHVTSRQMSWLQKKKQYQLLGNVVINDSQKRFILKTDQATAYYLKKSSSIYLIETQKDFLFTILQENLAITCDTFQVWKEEKKLACLHNVQGKSPLYAFAGDSLYYFPTDKKIILQRADTKPVVIEYNNEPLTPKIDFRVLADRVVFLQAENKLHLEGKVEVVNLLNSDYFSAGVVDLFFNEKNSVKSIHAQDHFTFHQDDQIATADMATYILDQKKLVLSGNVYAKKGDAFQFSSQSAIIFIDGASWHVQTNHSGTLKFDINDLDVN